MLNGVWGKINDLGTMGRSKNLVSGLVRGPGTWTIIMMGLIVSVTVWYGLKDHTALLKKGIRTIIRNTT